MQFYDTTHIVGTRHEAHINNLLCTYLPFDHEDLEPFQSLAEDTIDFEPLEHDHHYSQFKHLTNLPNSIHLQEGARVMFLNNKLFSDDICNGSIGIITKLIDINNVEVTFPTFTNITKVIVQKETSYFYIDGKRASRNQFPLQNAFALTTHKVQGLTLPHVTTSVDASIFAEGQAYVAMSRATS